MVIGALVFLGCPLRDVLRMAGGDYNAVDAGAVVIGMTVGAGFAHNFLLAGSAMTKSAAGAVTSYGGVGIYGQIACIVGIVLMFIIGFVYREE